MFVEKRNGEGWKDFHVRAKLERTLSEPQEQPVWTHDKLRKLVSIAYASGVSEDVFDEPMADRMIESVLRS